MKLFLIILLLLASSADAFALGGHRVVTKTIYLQKGEVFFGTEAPRSESQLRENENAFLALVGLGSLVSILVFMGPDFIASGRKSKKA